MYYIRIGDENRGPFSLEQLHMRGVSPDEFVWCEGMNDWQAASQCADLAGVLREPRQASPALAVQQSPPYQQHAPELPKHSRAGKWGFGLGAISVINTVICFALMVVFASLVVDMVQIPMEDIRAEDMERIAEDIERIPVEDWPSSVVSVALIICGLILLGALISLVGLCVSVSALTKPARVKVLPILGLLLNGAVFAGSALFLAVSLLNWMNS